jgi:hypothetical protein
LAHPLRGKFTTLERVLYTRNHDKHHLHVVKRPLAKRQNLCDAQRNTQCNAHRDMHRNEHRFAFQRGIQGVARAVTCGR